MKPQHAYLILVEGKPKYICLNQDQVIQIKKRKDMQNAEVIKVEIPKKPDLAKNIKIRPDQQAWLEQHPEINVSGLFKSLFDAYIIYYEAMTRLAIAKTLNMSSTIEEINETTEKLLELKLEILTRYTNKDTAIREIEKTIKLLQKYKEKLEELKS